MSLEILTNEQKTILDNIFPFEQKPLPNDIYFAAKRIAARAVDVKDYLLEQRHTQYRTLGNKSFCNMIKRRIQKCIDDNGYLTDTHIWEMAQDFKVSCYDIQTLANDNEIDSIIYSQDIVKLPIILDRLPPLRKDIEDVLVNIFLKDPTIQIIEDLAKIFRITRAHIWIWYIKNIGTMIIPEGGVAEENDINDPRVQQVIIDETKRVNCLSESQLSVHLSDLVNIKPTTIQIFIKNMNAPSHLKKIREKTSMESDRPLLAAIFNRNPYPEEEEIEILSRILDMQVDQIKSAFRSKRSSITQRLKHSGVQSQFKQFKHNYDRTLTEKKQYLIERLKEKNGRITNLEFEVFRHETQLPDNLIQMVIDSTIIENLPGMDNRFENYSNNILFPVSKPDNFKISNSTNSNEEERKYCYRSACKYILP